MGRTSGFVYIYKDRKYNRLYVGSHWGPEDDGYICSSNWMRNAHRRRPQDFRRRILKRIHTTYEDLIAEEQRWLDMIKPEEVGKRYYNMNLVAKGWSWMYNKKAKEIVGKKISRANKRLMTAKWKDPEYRESQLKTHWSLDEDKRKAIGQKISTSPERAAKISAGLKKRYAEDPEYRKKQSEGAKKQHAEGRF